MVQKRAASWMSSDYSIYSSVMEMMSNLGWRSLENRCYDARLTVFYKIVYGLVAIPFPSYFECPEVSIRHTHPPSGLQTDSHSRPILSVVFLFPHDCGSMEQITS